MPTFHANRPGDHVHASHRLVEERSEQSPKVERIVDGNAIEQHEILIGLATADVETGR